MKIAEMSFSVKLCGVVLKKRLYEILEQPLGTIDAKKMFKKFKNYKKRPTSKYLVGGIE